MTQIPTRLWPELAWRTGLDLNCTSHPQEREMKPKKRDVWFLV